MFPGVVALLERSLRIDARAWGTHFARFGLMVAIYIAVILTVATNNLPGSPGAPGMRLFYNIANLNLFFMTLLGISFFSTVITEEKEEDTLGLMLMAGISPLGILLGKTGSRLICAMLLVAVQYPFTLLTITLGGVTPIQIQSTYAALFSFLVMLAGVGLFCSTISPQNRTASMYMVLAIVAYWSVPLGCKAILAKGTSVSPFFEPVFQWAASSSVFSQIDIILQTGFSGTMFSEQVVTNLSIGGLSFVASWLLFDVATRDPAPEASNRGLVTRSGRFGWWFSPGRARGNPLAWRDFHFVAGGKPAVLCRLAFYPSLFLLATIYSRGFFAMFLTTGTTAKAITVTYLNLTLVAMVIDAGLVVSRSLHEEIRANTFTTLTFLPYSPGEIIYSKVLGSLLNWLPGPFCLILGVMALPHGPECFVDFFKALDHGLWLYYVAHLILIPHLAAVFAMFVRRGALPLAICCSFASLVFVFMVFVSLSTSVDSGLVPGAGLLVLAVCGFCHFVVWLRAEALLAR